MVILKHLIKLVVFNFLVEHSECCQFCARKLILFKGNLFGKLTKTRGLNDLTSYRSSLTLLDDHSIWSLCDRNDNRNVENLNSFVADYMVLLIKWYKNNISPIMPPNCRFLPSCSSYALQAIDLFGPRKGLVLIIWRLIRCNPTGGAGYDPPRWPPPDYWAGSYGKK